MTQEERKDAIMRIESLTEQDAAYMEPEFLWRLTNGFLDEYLVKLIISKGHNKEWKKAISNHLKNAYNIGYGQLSMVEIKFYEENGMTYSTPYYFKNIDFDIATNRLILHKNEDSEGIDSCNNHYVDNREPIGSWDEIPEDDGIELNEMDEDFYFVQIESLNKQLEEKDCLLEEKNGRIAELEDENKQLKNQSEKKYKKSQDRIAELEIELEQVNAEKDSLKKQLEECRNEENYEEIQWHDKVRLELLLRLLEEDGTDLQNVVKARVAEVINTITGLPISTCKNYCSNRNLNTETHKEEILIINSKLQAIGISFIL